ncbi:hypothetical protein C0992_005786 [Termitomyces sp. T32_za158]|nr:hypothetical protein C0992_005786 [Termitomyces sp. T32_za158]
MPNPPPPPPDEPLSPPAQTPRPTADQLASPGRTLRPLPDPHLQAHHRQLHTNNVDHIPATPEDEEEWMNIDGANPGRERGFVGGFVSGLRRLPKVVLKYRNFGDKRKYFRRDIYGSGGTLTNGTFTNGTDTVNTLPLYASNPSTPIAVSSTRFMEALEMPVPHPPEAPTPLIPATSLSQRRHHPSFRISPPSADDHQHAVEPPVAPAHPSTPAEIPGRSSNAVTIYNIPEQEDYQTEEPALPLPAATPNRLSNSQSQNPRSPAASIPADGHTPGSPVFVPPQPTPDYRKMTISPSPHPTGMVSAAPHPEPSFSSQLSPMKSFLIKLYRLPWIAPERVTEDYQPGGRDARYRITGGVKRPMSSWYKGTPGVVLSVKNGSGEADLLSSSSDSMRASTRASTCTSSTPLSSPGPRVRNRSSDHHRTHHREPRRRTHHDNDSSRNRGRSHRHRDTVVSATTDYQSRTNSPMIPTVYPYPYPFPIPYPTFSAPAPAPAPPPQRTQSQSAPRGPRPHRTPTYPHGYVPYHPPQPHPPVFLVPSPAQSASSVDHSHAQTQVVSSMYVPVSLVPGAFPQETTQQVASPPAATVPASAVPTSHATDGVLD